MCQLPSSTEQIRRLEEEMMREKRIYKKKKKEKKKKSVLDLIMPWVYSTLNFSPRPNKLGVLNETMSEPSLLPTSVCTPPVNLLGSLTFMVISRPSLESSLGSSVTSISTPTSEKRPKPCSIFALARRHSWRTAAKLAALKTSLQTLVTMSSLVLAKPSMLIRFTCADTSSNTTRFTGGPSSPQNRPSSNIADPSSTPLLLLLLLLLLSLKLSPPPLKLLLS